MSTNVIERVDKNDVKVKREELFSRNVTSDEWDKIERREILRPYKRQRLGFEGVLINILEPNRKNGFTYGLVFASVYSPKVNIELDHVVIKVTVPEFNYVEFELFKRYYFTAEVAPYYKTGYVLGIAAKRECFMLQNINISKVRQIATSQMSQPTLYVTTRIKNVLLCKSQHPRHTEDELLEIVKNTPNDGSVERFINEYTKSYQQKKITKHEVVETLYG